MDENIIIYKEAIEKIKMIYKYLPKEQEKVTTIPKIFNKAYSENFFSDYIGYLLDPSVNGVGTQPIKMLLSELGDENTRQKREEYINLINENTKIEIIREYTFADRRRIDILIVIDDFLIIGIENKIFSGESDNQTKDYQNNIENEYSDYDQLFYFLTLYGEKANNENFKNIIYKDLYNVFKKVHFGVETNIRKKIIFEDFIIHMEEYFLKKEFIDLSEKTKLYIDNYEVLKKLKESYDSDSKDYFDNILVGKFASVFNDNYEFDFKSDRNFQQIYKQNWKTNAVFIHIEFFVWSGNIFLDSDFMFTFDIEGKEKDEFRAFVEEKYRINLEQIEMKFNNPDKRKVSLFSKYINNPFFEKEEDNKFIKCLEEIREITSFFDEAINEYKSMKR